MAGPTGEVVLHSYSSVNYSDSQNSTSKTMYNYHCHNLCPQNFSELGFGYLIPDFRSQRCRVPETSGLAGNVLLRLGVHHATYTTSLQDHPTSVSIRGRPLCNLSFADGINLIVGSNSKLQEFTEACCQCLWCGNQHRQQQSHGEHHWISQSRDSHEKLEKNIALNTWAWLYPRMVGVWQTFISR